MRLRPPQIIQAPDPTLRKVSTPVEYFDDYLLHLIDEMKHAMDSVPGVVCIGLSAVQLGEPKRVVVVVQGGQKIALVNPVLKFSHGIQTVADGCMSVNGGTYFRRRARPRLVGIEYQDEKGKQLRRRAEGFNAAVIAHELDHLEGKLFTDGLEDAA